MLALACAALTAIAPSALAQDPWNTRLSASLSPVPIGACGVVSIALSDEATRDTPRTPQGWRVSMSDFDMSVQSDDLRALVGKYNGATSFSVCACQAGTVGANAAITATYPAKALGEKARVVVVAYSVSIPITTKERIGTMEPQGCPSMTSTSVAASQTPMRKLPSAIRSSSPRSACGSASVATSTGCQALPVGAACATGVADGAGNCIASSSRGRRLEIDRPTVTTSITEESEA